MFLRLRAMEYNFSLRHIAREAEKQWLDATTIYFSLHALRCKKQQHCSNFHITDLLCQFPRKWWFGSLEHMKWKRCFIRKCFKFCALNSNLKVKFTNLDGNTATGINLTAKPVFTDIITHLYKRDSLPPVSGARIVGWWHSAGGSARFSSSVMWLELLTSVNWLQGEMKNISSLNKQL